MNLYHSTMKGLRECREARRHQSQQIHSPELPLDDYKKKARKAWVFTRLFHRH